MELTVAEFAALFEDDTAFIVYPDGRNYEMHKSAGSLSERFGDRQFKLAGVETIGGIGYVYVDFF